MAFETDVFINCPFDDAYATMLEAMLFCITVAGLTPRLATERLEAGQNRLDKIYDLARGARFSVHDLSRCQAAAAGDYARMNMPFELGLDLGIRRAADLPAEKRFLIFERKPYETKRVLSDLAGQDVEAHHDDYREVIRHLRNFLRVEAGCAKLPGPARIIADYETFQGWMLERKIFEGHSEREAMRLPTSERLEAMRDWITAGKPAEFRA